MPELDRREFLKIVGLSAGAAATAACKEPIERTIPYLIQPEEVTPGIATYYHSACRECPGGCGITVKTREGRPIKLEGRAGDPISGGALCARGQFALQRTYDAARFRTPMRKGPGGLEPTTWEDALDQLTEKLRSNPGRAFFLGGSESGALDALIDRFMAAAGSPQRLRYEPFAHEALRAANRALFGTDAVPQFRLGDADVIVAFGTDFLETWLSPVRNQREWTRGRSDGRGFAAFVGPRLGLSASNTDQWLAPEPGTEILVALALAREVGRLRGTAAPALRNVLERFAPEAVAARTGIAAETLAALARRIAEAHAPLALPPGVELQGTNAAAFAAAVQLLNHTSGAIGRTVVFGPDHNVAGLGRFGDLVDLAGKMRGEQVRVLLLHGANPVYNAPQVAFDEALKGVFLVSFSSANDETTALADLVLPDHTPFESWGDMEPIVGVRQLQQPTLRPLFETRALGDVLLEVARRLGQGAAFPEATFYDVLHGRWGGTAALEAGLAQGGTGTPAPARRVELDPAGLAQFSFEPTQLLEGAEGDLALVVYPSLHFYDGRSARIAYLHEIPDPVLKTMWGHFAELHHDTANKLGVQLGDRVRVETEAGSTELPVFPHAGVRAGVVAIQAGQGQQPVDPQAPDPVDRRNQRAVTGANAYALIPGRRDATSGGLAWYGARARLTRAAGQGLVIRAQLTFDQENRGFAKAMTLAAYRQAQQAPSGAHGEEHGAQAPSGRQRPAGRWPAGGSEPQASEGSAHGDAHGAPAEGTDVYGIKPLPGQGAASHLVTRSYDPAHDAHPDSAYRWGMDIDLEACTGCNACMAACAVENNTPVVGVEATRTGREMHWIRVERYVESVGDVVDVRHLPMLCQHCGAAPCESVCPVLATYHSPEGLNVMIPNRCIGTRFCSNNCPYKVRRFNHWSYDWAYREPENLALNPDVMVRAKGVMEKCTFCVQRIAAGKDQARREGRAVRDGDITPACAQTCPSEAIRFGNLRDPHSRVTQLRGDARAYRVLEHLYTRPAVNYQRGIRRLDPQEQEA